MPSGSDQTVIQGNIIGRSADGTSAIPNNNHAVFLASSNNSVGGISAGQGNLIASNTGKGVVVLNGGTGNAILGNSIYGNTSIGIDLSNNGVSANNGTKSGATANYGMDYPVFTSATLNGNTLTVGGYVGSAPNQSLFANARVEIFKSDNDGSGYGEGQTYLGSLNTDANGNFSGSLSVIGLAAGDRLTGTATDGSNNTSEFGPSNIPVILYYTLSGRVYTDEGATPIGAGKTIRVLINGTSLGTGVTDGSGDYSITAPYNSGQAVLVYIEDDAVYKGVTASVLNASSLSGFYIYAGHVITRQDNGGILSNANLGGAKGSYADTDILYSVSGSDLTVSGSGTTLYLPPGQSYQPGGNISTSALKSLGTLNSGSGMIDVNGALTISGGSFTASSGTTYVAGNLGISGGIFIHNSGTFVFDGSNDSSVSAASATFNNITVSKGPTVPPNPVKLTLTGNLTVNGALTIDTGMLDQGGASNLRAGSVAINEGGILWNRGTGSLTLGGAVTNTGEVNLNGGGDGTTCGSGTKIQIRSTSDGTQRLWSGAGFFDMVDVDVKDQGGSASITVYGGTNAGNNGANWTFNADCVGAPTAVSLVSFSASAHRGEILLRWLTGYEVNNLGFHVYREEGGSLHRLTPELVAGSALKAGSGVGLRGGKPYMWLDSSLTAAQESGAKYWLEDVDLNGKRTWHGPAAPGVSFEPLPEKVHVRAFEQSWPKGGPKAGKLREDPAPERKAAPCAPCLCRTFPADPIYSKRKAVFEPPQADRDDASMGLGRQLRR